MPHYPHVLQGRHGRVSVTRCPVKGKPGLFRYTLRWRRGRKGFKERTYQEDRALSRAAELFEQIKAGDEAMHTITKERIAYLLACEQVLGGEADLMSVVVDWKNRGTVSDIRLEDAIAQYGEEQGKRGLSERHLTTVSHHLNRFKKEAGAKIEVRTIDVAAINRFLDNIPGAVYRDNHRRSLNSFFAWCKVHKFNRENPVTGSNAPVVRATTPKVLTPENFETLIHAAESRYPNIVLFMALGAFAGIRAAEIQRLRREDVNLAAGVIHLSCEITKTNIPRTVRIPANLAVWLEAYLPSKGLLVTHPNPSVVIQRLCRRTKVAWAQNGLRHSFVTYMVQLSRNNGDVAEQCGHSLYVSATRYKALSDPDTAGRWFAILPLTEDTVSAT